MVLDHLFSIYYLSRKMPAGVGSGGLGRQLVESGGREVSIRSGRCEGAGDMGECEPLRAVSKHASAGTFISLFCFRPHRPEPGLRFKVYCFRWGSLAGVGLPCLFCEPDEGVGRSCIMLQPTE